MLNVKKAFKIIYMQKAQLMLKINFLQKSIKIIKSNIAKIEQEAKRQASLEKDIKSLKNEFDVLTNNMNDLKSLNEEL